MQNVYGIIMAGGIGSRFWPLSRAKKPKQFLDILGQGRTFIQQTFDRLAKFIPMQNILVVTGNEYRELVAEQLPQVLPHNIICEPLRKNTAACIAYTAYKLQQTNPQATMVVVPSDHLITDDTEFVNTMKDAVRFAQTGDYLVTIGIKPTRPETGYGYIQISEGAGSDAELGICKVKTFTEKPNAEMAQAFINSREFYWNSGMFIWSLNSICKALETYLPETAKLFVRCADRYNTPQEPECIENVYTECKSISIDYGIMEKAVNVYVICAGFGWSDVGAWTSLYLQSCVNEDGNVIGNSNVILQNVKNSLIKASPEKLVVLQHLDGYLVVDTPDVLLVCKRGDDNEIKQIVDKVRLEKTNSA